MRSFLTPLVRIAERPRLVLGLAMGLLVAAGLVMAVQDGPRMKSLDEVGFLDLSGNLAFHGTFAHTNRPDIEGFDRALPLGVLRPTAYRAPGWVWFQVPFRWMGGNYALLRVANAILLALTLWLLHGLVTRHAGRLGGAVSVVLVLLYPVLLYAAGTLYPQTLSAFLLVGAVRQLDTLRPSAPSRRFVLLGVTLAALVLTVPIHLLLLPVVAAWMLAARRSTGRQLGVTLLTVAGLVGLWVLRNSLVLGAVVGIATSTGFNLLAGNGPYVRHDQTTSELRWPPGVRDQVVGKGEVERDRILGRAALRWIAENPGQATALYGRKLLYWFAPTNELASDRLVPGGSGAGPRWQRDVAMLLGYGLLVSILFVRLVLARRDRLSSLEVLLLALYLGGGIAYAVFFTRIRFRLPFDWLLIAVDALFLARVLETVAGGRISGGSGRRRCLISSGDDMGLLDRLLRGRAPDAGDGKPLTPEAALARWRYLVGKAPPETLAEAHSRALDSLGDVPRSEVVQRLRSGLAALETGVVVPTEPALVLRAAARAERRTPGFLERTLGSDARGRQTLSGLAAAVVATSAALPFLKGFDSAAETAASGGRRSQELDVDAPATPGSSDDHDHDLDDED